MRFLAAEKIPASTIDLEFNSRLAEEPRREISLLFVHGIYHGAWAFDENLVPYFSQRGYDCFSYSWRAHGKSSGQDKIKSISFDDYLSDLRQAINKINRDRKNPLILIGHSAGASLIQKHLESEEATGAVLMASTSAKALKEGRAKLAAKFFWPILKLAVTGNPDHLYHDAKACREILFNGDNSELTNKALGRLLMQPESHRMIKDLFEVEIGKPKKNLPTLVIGAGQDLGCPKSAIDEIAERYVGSVAIFDDAAHELFLMPGWERVAEKIESWLKGAF